MISFTLYIGATVLFAQSTLAYNCSRPPVYVDIHKRAVHDSPVFQYGSFIGVGTPAQNHSLWPSLSQNHTSFASRSYCGNSTLRNCDVSTGGFFQPRDSTSFSEQKGFESLDSSNNTSKGFFGQDTVRLYTHYFETDGASQTLLENSTVKVPEAGSHIPSLVGMGDSSTVLRDLASRDMIAGRTYSLYIGQGFDRAGGSVNGSNTFGGYDSGRFTGPISKYPMDTSKPNPMSVTVKDIIITDPTKPTASQKVSLFDQSAFPSMSARPEPFTAEITTDQYPLSLPYELTQNFISHLDAVKDNSWNDDSLKLKAPFSGSLTIVLSDGFTVTLPSTILSNASNITPIQSRDQRSTSPFYLSTAFLTQVYLMVDFDAQSFFLAQAVQKNNAVMPVPFCSKTTPVAYVPPKQNAWLKQGLIGAVIGGVLGGIGVLGCVWCFARGWVAKREERKERKLERELEKGRREAKMAQLEIEDVPEFEPPPGKGKTKRSAKGLFSGWKR